MPLAKTGEPLRVPGVRIVRFNKMFYTYILLSEVDGTHYYGHTSDLIERLKTHNLGKVRYTKGRRPWKIIYSEPFDTKSEACKREIFFKSIEGYRYLRKAGIT
jgi:putative endonuclease